MTKLAAIGAGMMGGAVIKGIIEKKVLDPASVVISDPDQAKVKALCEKLGAKAAASNTEAVKDADIILLAVKPQFLDGVLAELKGKIRKDTLVMTVVVSISTAVYAEKLGAERVIRIMPNTPAQVGEGVLAWVATEAVSAEQKAMGEKILSALGMQFEVKKESDLDLITTISGSGPAYVYLFIEAMTDTAVQIGLPRPLAEKIVLQTVIGSSLYMKQTGKHPVILKNEVTSPGGTTAAALAAMEKEGMRTAITEGILANLEKTRELGKK